VIKLADIWAKKVAAEKRAALPAGMLRKGHMEPMDFLTKTSAWLLRGQ